MNQNETKKLPPNPKSEKSTSGVKATLMKRFNKRLIKPLPSKNYLEAQKLSRKYRKNKKEQHHQIKQKNEKLKNGFQITPSEKIRAKKISDKEKMIRSLRAPIPNLNIKNIVQEETSIKSIDQISQNLMSNTMSHANSFFQQDQVENSQNQNGGKFIPKNIQISKIGKSGFLKKKQGNITKSAFNKGFEVKSIYYQKKESHGLNLSKNSNNIQKNQIIGNKTNHNHSNLRKIKLLDYGKKTNSPQIKKIKKLKYGDPKLNMSENLKVNNKTPLVSNFSKFIPLSARHNYFENKKVNQNNANKINFSQREVSVPHHRFKTPQIIPKKNFQRTENNQNKALQITSIAKNIVQSKNMNLKKSEFESKTQNPFQKQVENGKSNLNTFNYKRNSKKEYDLSKSNRSKIQSNRLIYTQPVSGAREIGNYSQRNISNRFGNGRFQSPNPVESSNHSQNMKKQDLRSRKPLGNTANFLNESYKSKNYFFYLKYFFKSKNFDSKIISLD